MRRTNVRRDSPATAGEPTFLPISMFYGVIFALLIWALPAVAASFANGQGARLVVGQTSFTDESPTPGQAILGAAGGVAVGGNRLFIVDSSRMTAQPINQRLLIYNDLQRIVPDPAADIPQSSACP